MSCVLAGCGVCIPESNQIVISVQVRNSNPYLEAPLWISIPERGYLVFAAKSSAGQTLAMNAEKVPLAPDEDRGERLCPNEDLHSGEWIRHVDEGVVSRKAKCMQSKGRIDESPSNWEFVRKQVPPIGRERAS